MVSYVLGFGHGKLGNWHCLASMQLEYLGYKDGLKSSLLGIKYFILWQADYLCLLGFKHCLASRHIVYSWILSRQLVSSGF
jgi:hypothetical protein